MNSIQSMLAAFLIAVCTIILLSSSRGEAGGSSVDQETKLSFKSDVFPIIKKYCLPCHAEENFNPSELSLDSYDDLMAGGKHGSPVVPGKAKESVLIQKLGASPPFGDPMPLQKKDAPPVKRLTDQEVVTIAEWITQGAKAD